MATLKGTKPSREHQSVWSQQEKQRMRDDITILYDIVHQLADGLGYKLDIRISPSAKLTKKVVMSSAAFPSTTDLENRYGKGR